MADDLPAPRPGWFSLTVLYTVHETCRMCDVVMDTLKKNHTVQAFHTAHIVLDRETNSNVTSHYIKAFVLPNMRQLFSSILFSFFFLFLLLAIQRENFVCYCREMTQAQSPCISFKHFKRKKNLHLNISLRLRIVPVPHWTIYCCWLSQQGGVVFGVTVLQPEDLDSISRDSWNPPCWGALRIHDYKDAALKRRKTVINTEKAQNCSRTTSKWLLIILFMWNVSTVVSFQRCRNLASLFINHSALVCISEGSRLTDLPLKLYLITHKSFTRSPNLCLKQSKTNWTVWPFNLIIPWLCTSLVLT